MNDEWETPLDLFSALNKEFEFEFDLCANEDNKRCALHSSDIKFYVEGIEAQQAEGYWMNPPYSRPKIAGCMEQAYTLSVMNNLVVCLVRFDPSAKWFQNWVDGKATEVRMLNRRVKFQGADSAYNFPCCVVVYMEGYATNYTDTDYHIWGWK